MRTAVVAPALLASLWCVPACTTRSGPSEASDGGAATCAALRDHAATAVLDVVSANQACTVDTDCETMGISARCFSVCTRPVAAAGKAAIEDAIAEANRTTCAEFVEAGCTHFEPPCEPPNQPRCRAGRCVEAE